MTTEYMDYCSENLSAVMNSTRCVCVHCKLEFEKIISDEEFESSVLEEIVTSFTEGFEEKEELFLEETDKDIVLSTSVDSMDDLDDPSKFQVIHHPWEFKSTIDDDVICPNCNVNAVIGNATISWTSEDIDRWHIEGFKTFSQNAVSLASKGFTEIVDPSNPDTIITTYQC